MTSMLEKRELSIQKNIKSAPKHIPKSSSTQEWKQETLWNQ